eukprot:TRINITY_DN2756_c0_g4_i1.p1 TRINITY_DN2756_c0_g4~~TRINITY_DN2756_c0_g4_i1.p1  ORF type:complete len:1073 (+),score=231.60 TRINITY_DN2756_c0_g4_i1:41-3220(+)
MANLWKVVGGADRGGILVRKGRYVNSDAEDSRLNTDAIVKELGIYDGRLHYELVSGEGPEKGWVTTHLRGKDLLMRHGSQARSKDAARGFSQWAKLEEHHSDDSTNDGSGSELGSALKGRAQKELSPEESEAMRFYAHKFGEACEGRLDGFDRKHFPWCAPQSKQTPQETVEEALVFKDQVPHAKKQEPAKLSEVDSDGEDVPLCEQCYLPIGEFSYHGKRRNTCVHAECMAQVIAEEGQLAEEDRLKEEKEIKHQNRLEYDIGWRMQSVPKSSVIAERLGCSPVPKGLCCLVYDEVARTVKIAATHEPAASVNLEYLLLALKVRRDAVREPMFSLDPVDPKNIEKSAQKKRYEPSWLAGTSVGEVMFQADYFLKEAAFGEFNMPVAGMLSVFDWSELENWWGAEWAGREWFVVNKAEVHIASDNTLIPRVKMGVEAREQQLTSAGLEDKPVTAAGHPLKKYADSFTRNFDLIAERKSVIFHLRELAKASVMAKFLVDSNANVDKSWYSLADDIVNGVRPEANPEIPQLWNMRGNSRIQLKNGRLLDLATGGRSSLRAIYGGVQFGLDKFELSQRASIQAGPGGRSLGRFELPQRAGMQAGALPAQQLTAPQRMQIGARQPMFMPQRFQLGSAPATSDGRPQGVDLNLDKFSLDAPDRMNGLWACSASLDSVEARVTLGRAFLQGLQQGCFGLKEEHQAIMKRLFNPSMCDRTEEGHAFIPPDASVDYVSKLKNLVKEEERVLERRKTRFFDKSFLSENAGHEFPSDWTSRYRVEREGATGTTDKQLGLVQIVVDPAFEKILTTDILPAAAPEFNKVTEDGVWFRIYRIGSLEIRTTRDRSGQETVGAVFSRRAPLWHLSYGKTKEVRNDERIVQAKVYIEAKDAEDAQLVTSAAPSKYQWHFYIVLETEASNIIATERAPDGSIVWAVNPETLEDRNSLAKLLFTSDCKADCIRVQAIRGIAAAPEKPALGKLPMRAPRATDKKPTPDLSTSKAYAKAVFKIATGQFGFSGRWGGNARSYADSASQFSAKTVPSFQTGGTFGEFTNPTGIWTRKNRGL